MKVTSIKLSRIGKTNVGVVVVSLLGVFGFVLAKNQVVQNRYENMKARQRILQSISGDYESGPKST